MIETSDLDNPVTPAVNETITDGISCVSPVHPRLVCRPPENPKSRLSALIAYGKTLDRIPITDQELMAGGELAFTMGAQPAIR